MKGELEIFNVRPQNTFQRVSGECYKYFMKLGENLGGQMKDPI